jgi:hypothetical protein
MYVCTYVEEETIGFSIFQDFRHRSGVVLETTSQVRGDYFKISSLDVSRAGLWSHINVSAEAEPSRTCSCGSDENGVGFGL